MKTEKYKILYVDDSEANLFLFVENFEDDYNIFTAISAEKGLRIVKQENLDLIISDQAMPLITGVEFFEQVLKVNPAPNRILLTAYANFTALADAVNKAKIFQYVSKPWDKDNLKIIIENAISEYHLRRENELLTDELYNQTKVLESLLESKTQLVTRLEETNEKLEVSEQKLQRLIEFSPLPIGISDLENNIITLNNQFINTFGYTLEDIPTVDIWYPKAYPDKDYRDNHIKKWKEKFAKAQKNDGELPPLEAMVTCKNGDKKIIQMHTAIIEDIFIVMFNDLTQLRSLEEDISYRIKMEEELRKAKNRADAASKSKSEFIASMSHEIRTPMNSILGFAKVIENELTDPTLIDYIKSIQSGGETLLSLINDILDFSKIEAGKINLNYGYLDIHDILKDIELVFKFKIENKGLKFITDIKDNVSKYYFLDELRIKQILLNLISNAVKFTEQGFVKITVESESLNKDEAKLRIQVEDSGIGIAEKQQKKVFDVFEQAEGKDNRRYEGTGLGLAISSKLAKAMNGNIELRSEQGNGSVFTICFNKVRVSDEFVMEDKDMYEVETDYKPIKQKLDRSKLLIVDDVEDNRKILSLYLKKYNLDITEAKNGVEAISILDNEKFDMVLLDLNMPEKDGYQVLKYMRDKLNLKQVPVIAMTAFTLNNERKKVLEAGFSDYLSKPIDFYLVDNLLQKYISGTQVNTKPNNSLTKNAILSEIAMEHLPELVKEIEIKGVPLLEQMEKIRPKKIVNEFSELLMELGKRYSCQNLSWYGNELRKANQAFNVEKEKLLINQFVTFFNQLKNYKK